MSAGPGPAGGPGTDPARIPVVDQVVDPAAGPAPSAAPDPLAQAAQATAVARRNQRVPTEPYPGLRPFLDFEETLLFGRERQVREVIDRLGQTQFVAVIGGSGSGKSSLILAGVVPELRSFGIPDAGDFWVPMVCTPGTNATAADQAQRSDTPITRLARRFAALLKPRATPEATADRLDEIAGHLRRELGFANLVDLYTPELAAPPGPKPEDARFLFVIDQFEELFHPTNRGVEDGRLLVERVIDHFFSPHRRCYLVLTMRSEHLADCAGYLELPDAINKASYLVRRLDAAQLQEAISGPAQRLLRIRQRLDDDDARLPATVQFDDEVMKRLLRDVQAITADPDHLPLLQHLLARLWQAGLKRVKARADQPLDLPDLIGPADLAMAVSAAQADPAAASTPAPALDAQTNTLRACLENWAQALYMQHPEAERVVIDGVLRRLAIKDPNTGMYSQQRIHVDEAARLLGPDATRADLRRLLAGGFLGQVDYLFWDDDNPERVTLKVSHESFIRGWLHFRGLIDQEAERFEAFIDLLRKCRQWQAHQRDDALLLEANDLKRSDSARLASLLGQPDERAAWFRRLSASRDGLLLGPMEAVVGDFLAASQQRQQAAQHKLKKAKQRKVLVWIALLLALPPILFWTLVQGPVVERAGLMFQAMTLAGSAEVRAERPGEATAQPAVGASSDDLQALVGAVQLLDQAASTAGSLRMRLHQWLLGALRGMPLVGGQAEFIDQVTRVAEPPVNANLRRLLESTAWRAPATGGAPDDQVKTATTKTGQTCNQPPPEGSLPGGMGQVLVPGDLITAESPDNPRLARSVFARSQPDNATAIELWAANVHPITKECTLAQELMRLPRSLKPVVAFDANLRHLLYTTTVNDRNDQVATIVQIDWELTDDDGSRTVRKNPRLVLTDPQDAARLAQAAQAAAAAPAVAAGSASSPAVVGVLPTRRAVAGRVFTVGNTGWRLFDPPAQRIGAIRAAEAATGASSEAASSVAPAAAPAPGQVYPGFRALQEAPAGSACQRLAGLLPSQPGFSLQSLTAAAEGPCYVVTRGKPPDGDGPPPSKAEAAPLQKSAQRDEQVLVAVYAQPSDTDLRAAGAPEPGANATASAAMTASAASASSAPYPAASANQVLAPVASLPRFARVRPGETLTWQVGLPGGPQAGWIGVESPNNTGKLRLVAAPYGTLALRCIGLQVLADQGVTVKADRNNCHAP